MTTDAQLRNCLHCMDENQLPLPNFRYGQSIFHLPHRPKFSDFFDLCLNWVSTIYSWSIGHILEHEFFCLGWAGSKEKKWIWVFLCNFWGCFFQLFEGKKIWSFFFFLENIVHPALYKVFTFFLVILMILLTAEHLRFFIYISVCCWTFELSLLLNLWDYPLLLNLWIFFTAEPLDFLYCWTFKIMPWIMYLFTAEPLEFIYCWTFEIICLLLNLWIFFTAEPLNFFTAEPLRLCPGLCICLLLNLWEGSAVNKITKIFGYI